MLARFKANNLLGVVAIAAGLAVASPAFAKAPDTWDDLVKVESKRFDSAYLLPGADFSTYTKVMIDPTEAAFKKDWQRDYNASARGGDRITDDEALEILAKVQDGFRDILVKAYQDAGYQVVTAPGPDVIRLRTAIINLDIAAPDQMTAGRSRTYSSEAGQATLAIEARDSMSGAVLARGVDKRDIGDSAFVMRRSAVSNRSDFERAFTVWAGASVDALGALRELPPLPVEGAQ